MDSLQCIQCWSSILGRQYVWWTSTPVQGCKNLRRNPSLWEHWDFHFKQNKQTLTPTTRNRWRVPLARESRSLREMRTIPCLSLVPTFTFVQLRKVQMNHFHSCSYKATEEEAATQRVEYCYTICPPQLFIYTPPLPLLPSSSFSPQRQTLTLMCASCIAQRLSVGAATR